MADLKKAASNQAAFPWQLDLGAIPSHNGETLFRVWAPLATTIEVEVLDALKGRIPLQQNGEYFEGVAPAKAGDRYWYWLDGKVRRPDPGSRSQPEGVHGPSQVMDLAFPWSDGDWHGIALEDCIFYELHVGAFTPEGTFDAASKHLGYLKELGVTVVQLMPVFQFPGTRNWGYDGVFPFAPQGSYGGVAGLKHFVNACHRQGLAVFLDVVYNHLGPEGNYLHAFGPFFTNRYRTPWGDAVNFDGPFSDGVRHYFISNALHWLAEYHIDGLRLDAVHDIFDFSARHILAELVDEVHALEPSLGRSVYVIAESDLNDPRIVTDRSLGGYGLDAQWNDDFHHALHTILTGETGSYYEDFGDFSQLLSAFRDSFVYGGIYSRYRRRRHGSNAAHLPSNRFVVFIQNHDQVGNRALGDRLAAHLSPEQLKLAIASVLLSPFLPLLFMGEEYGETAPFPYFTSHGDPELVEAVRHGRQDEFARFAWSSNVPDPQAEETFSSARITPLKRYEGWHAGLYNFIKEVIRLRKSLFAHFPRSRAGATVHGFAEEKVLMLQYRCGDDEAIAVFNFSNTPQQVLMPSPHIVSNKVLDSSDPRWDETDSSLCLLCSSNEGKQLLQMVPWGVCLHTSSDETAPSGMT